MASLSVSGADESVFELPPINRNPTRPRSGTGQHVGSSSTRPIYAQSLNRSSRAGASTRTARTSLSSSSSWQKYLPSSTHSQSREPFDEEAWLESEIAFIQNSLYPPSPPARKKRLFTPRNSLQDLEQWAQSSRHDFLQRKKQKISQDDPPNISQDDQPEIGQDNEQITHVSGSGSKDQDPISASELAAKEMLALGGFLSQDPNKALEVQDLLQSSRDQHQVKESSSDPQRTSFASASERFRSGMSIDEILKQRAAEHDQMQEQDDEDDEEDEEEEEEEEDEEDGEEGEDEDEINEAPEQEHKLVMPNQVTARPGLIQEVQQGGQDGLDDEQGDEEEEVFDQEEYEDEEEGEEGEGDEYEEEEYEEEEEEYEEDMPRDHRQNQFIQLAPQQSIAGDEEEEEEYEEDGDEEDMPQDHRQNHFIQQNHGQDVGDAIEIGSSSDEGVEEEEDEEDEEEEEDEDEEEIEQEDEDEDDPAPLSSSSLHHPSLQLPPVMTTSEVDEEELIDEDDEPTHQSLQMHTNDSDTPQMVMTPGFTSALKQFTDQHVPQFEENEGSETVQQQQQQYAENEGSSGTGTGWEEFLQESHQPTHTQLGHLYSSGHQQGNTLLGTESGSDANQFQDDARAPDENQFQGSVPQGQNQFEDDVPQGQDANQFQDSVPHGQNQFEDDVPQGQDANQFQDSVPQGSDANHFQDNGPQDANQFQDNVPQDQDDTQFANQFQDDAPQGQDDARFANQIHENSPQAPDANQFQVSFPEADSLASQLQEQSGAHVQSGADQFEKQNSTSIRLGADNKCQEQETEPFDSQLNQPAQEGQTESVDQFAQGQTDPIDQSTTEEPLQSLGGSSPLHLDPNSIASVAAFRRATGALAQPAGSLSSAGSASQTGSQKAEPTAHVGTAVDLITFKDHTKSLQQSGPPSLAATQGSQQQDDHLHRSSDTPFHIPSTPLPSSTPPLLATPPLSSSSSSRRSFFNLPSAQPQNGLALRALKTQASKIASESHAPPSSVGATVDTIDNQQGNEQEELNKMDVDMQEEVVLQETTKDARTLVEVKESVQSGQMDEDQVTRLSAGGSADEKDGLVEGIQDQLTHEQDDQQQQFTHEEDQDVQFNDEVVNTEEDPAVVEGDAGTVIPIESEEIEVTQADQAEQGETAVETEAPSEKVIAEVQTEDIADDGGIDAVQQPLAQDLIVEEQAEVKDQEEDSDEGEAGLEHDNREEAVPEDDDNGAGIEDDDEEADPEDDDHGARAEDNVDVVEPVIDLQDNDDGAESTAEIGAEKDESSDQVAAPTEAEAEAESSSNRLGDGDMLFDAQVDNEEHHPTLDEDSTRTLPPAGHTPADALGSTTTFTTIPTPPKAGGTANESTASADTPSASPGVSLRAMRKHYKQLLSGSSSAAHSADESGHNDLEMGTTKDKSESDSNLNDLEMGASKDKPESETNLNPSETSTNRHIHRHRHHDTSLSDSQDPPTTRSHCGFDRLLLPISSSSLTLTFIVPQCSIRHDQLVEESARTEGEARSADNDSKLPLSDTDTALMLDDTLHHRLSRIVGQELVDEVWVLPDECWQLYVEGQKRVEGNGEGKADGGHRGDDEKLDVKDGDEDKSNVRGNEDNEDKSDVKGDENDQSGGEDEDEEVANVEDALQVHKSTPRRSTPHKRHRKSGQDDRDWLPLDQGQSPSSSKKAEHKNEDGEGNMSIEALEHSLEHEDEDDDNEIGTPTPPPGQSSSSLRRSARHAPPTTAAAATSRSTSVASNGSRRSPSAPLVTYARRPVRTASLAMRAAPGSSSSDGNEQTEEDGKSDKEEEQVDSDGQDLSSKRKRSSRLSSQSQSQSQSQPDATPARKRTATTRRRSTRGGESSQSQLESQSQSQSPPRRNTRQSSRR